MGILSDIGQWLLDVVAVIGIGTGGTQAAAAADIDLLRQDSLRLQPISQLPPAMLAEAVLKGHTDQATAAAEARLSGVNGDRFDLMVRTTGNAPGPGDLLEMLRRGIIDEAGLTRGVRQGYLRDEWVQSILQLRWMPLSPAEVIQAAVQNELGHDDAQRIAAESGMNPDAFDIALRTAGDPPGPIETLRMLNRGIIDVEQATQALRESRIKDKYIPALLQLHETLVPARTITTLIGHGVITDDQARGMLAKLGYTDDVVTAFIASAHRAKTATTHDFTLATVRSLYADKIIDRPTAIADLVRIGWSEAEAGELLDLTDAVMLQRFRTTAIGKVHSLYVGYKLERAQAATDLDSVGVPGGQRDELLTLWDIERSANVKHLTVGELNQALKKGIIDQPTFVQRVTRMGYDQADAELLAAIDITASNTTSHLPTNPTTTGGSAP